MGFFELGDAKGPGDRGDEPAASGLRSGAAASEQLGREIVACAGRTLAAPGARIDFGHEWSFSSGDERPRRRRRGGLLRPVGRLLKRIVRFTWRRAMGGKRFGQLHGKGILEPAGGRYMIDFGLFAQVQIDGETFGGRSGRPLATLRPFPEQGATGDMVWGLRLLRGAVDATRQGEETLHGTRCAKLAAVIDMERASAAGEHGLRVPAVNRVSKRLRALGRPSRSV